MYHLSKREEASWKAFSQLFAILGSSGEWNACRKHCVHCKHTHTHSKSIQRDIQSALKLSSGHMQKDLKDDFRRILPLLVNTHTPTPRQTHILKHIQRSKVHAYLYAYAPSLTHFHYPVNAKVSHSSREVQSTNHKHMCKWPRLRRQSRQLEGHTTWVLFEGWGP